MHSLNLNHQGSSVIKSKIQQLLWTIQNSKVEQVKENSIINIHSKIQAKLIPYDKLPYELPPVIMEWINDHQQKSLALLKALEILNCYTKSSYGVQILKQFDAVQFFEGFKDNLRMMDEAKEYERLVNSIILSQFGLKEEERVDLSIKQKEEKLNQIKPLMQTKKRRNKSKDNLSESKNNEKKDQLKNQKTNESQYQSQTTSERQKQTHQQIPHSNVEYLQFKIPLQKNEDKEQNQLYELGAQLRYGNNDLKYKIMRELGDILAQNRSVNFRTKADLIKELEECVAKRQFENEAVNLLNVLFKGLVDSAALYKQTIKSNPSVPFVKFNFPLKQSYLQNPMMQQLMSNISKNFDEAWIQWLAPIKYPWVFPYIFKIVNQISKQTVQSPAVQKILKNILSTNSINFQSLTLNSGVVDVTKFHAFQTQKSYNHLRQFQDQQQIDWDQQFFGKIKKLKLGLQGLAYNPDLVEVYVDLAMQTWIKQKGKQPSGEHNATAINMLIEISSHTSLPVRQKLYQMLLKKAKMNQLKPQSRKSETQVISSILASDPFLLLNLIQNSIDEKQTCLAFMLELLLLVYASHAKVVHQTIKRITPILDFFTQYQTGKISNLSVDLLSNFDDKELIPCDLMTLFSKKKDARVQMSLQLLGYKGDVTELYQGLKLRKKELVIDEDCIINYIINISNHDLKISIRLSALKQLIECVQRAQLSSLLHSRLSTLNDLLMKQLMQIINEQKEDEQVWIGYILALAFQLFLKEIIGAKYLPSLQILVLIFKVYHSGRCKQLLSPLIGLIYSLSFLNPFSSKPEIYWLYETGEFLKLVDLETSERKSSKMRQLIVKESQKVGKDGKPNSENIPKVSNTMKYIEYVSERIESKQIFQISFKQVQQMISKAMLSNNLSTEYTFSALKSLFLLYSRTKSHFTQLSQQFQHLIPQLINYLNTKTTKHVEDDVMSIINCIGVKTDKQINFLLNNKKIQLRALRFARTVPKEIVESVLKGLPDDPGQLAEVLKALTDKKSLRGVTNEMALISLSSSLQKGIRSNNKKLEMYALQTLFSVLTPEFIDKNSSFFTLTIQHTQMSSLNPISVMLCLRILAKFITLSPTQSFLELIRDSNIVTESVKWLSSNKNTLVKIGCLELLNAIANTYLGDSFDLTITFINQLDTIFQERSSDQQIVQNLLLIYEACSGILITAKSRDGYAQNFVNYLLGTELLENLLSVIKFIQTVVFSMTKDSLLYLERVLDVIACIFMLLLCSQDLFVMRLNKLAGQNAMNIIITFTQLVECSASFSKMVSRLLSVWKKSHQFLGESMLGRDLLHNIMSVTNNSYQSAMSVLAISSSSKFQFISKGYFYTYLHQAKITVDQFISSSLSTTKAKTKPRKKTNNTSMNSSAVHVSTETITSDDRSLRSVLIFLKSFFHPTEASERVKLQISGQLAQMTVSLLSKLQECCNIYPTIISQYQKVLCNLSASSQFRIILQQLINPKYSLVKDLMNSSLNHNLKQVNQNLTLLGILARQPEIRALVFRRKLVEELTSRIAKDWESSKDVEQSMEVVLEFLLQLSVHQDSQEKLIDKTILDLMLLHLQKHIEHHNSNLPSTILKLFCNMAHSKHNKSLIINSRDFHKTMLILITNKEVKQELRVYMADTIYNLLYKSAEAIGIYKKGKVLEELKKVRQSGGVELNEAMDRVVNVLEAEYK